MFFYQFTSQNAKATRIRAGARKRMWLPFYANHSCESAVKAQVNSEKSWTTVCSLSSVSFKSCLDYSYPCDPERVPFSFWLTTYVIHTAYIYTLYILPLYRTINDLTSDCLEREDLSKQEKRKGERIREIRSKILHITDFWLSKCTVWQAAFLLLRAQVVWVIQAQLVAL